MLTLNINPNLGNQEVQLSDKSTGQLSGVRISGGFLGNAVIQWTFISTGHKHEGFVYAGDLQEGQVITSLNNVDKYRVHFI
ncbi:hypothetical protein [Apilactobacillus ozensis]|uniref:Uncharacterized protein n=1 Tax=Apilactobacillus ozensis DSM 23829 = JCM 17196 TaxID=1423781 RepID=A0A0R2AKT1_9LACO|nr:hypothetical protein [Apilactobacillus ozensis]KRM67793.1 hypothetical protein FD06_GL000513 [Apilactobacillus ozensis DSM 23829 = JCM 17196]MCK8606932.1 hypothetical protein [Apilactobacillus ozensis]